MSATITDLFKKELLNELYTDFNGWDYDSTDSASVLNKYYIGIGRSEEWEDENSPPAPVPSKNDISIFQASLQGVKLATDLSYVVPRYNWSAGSIYTAWSDKNHSDTSVGVLEDIPGAYYVITDENNVYVCLQQGMTDDGTVRNSLYKPTDVSYEPFTAGADGYVWRFLFNVGTYTSRRYLTSHWLPVEHIYDSSVGGPQLDTLSASRLAQYGIQINAVPNQVMAIEVDSGGLGYEKDPVITINGECVDSAYAYARVDDNGKIFQLVLKDSSDGDWTMGSGYGEKTWVEITSATGEGAVLRPVVHNYEGGFGFDPRNDLNSSALMYSVRIIGDEYKIFNIDNDFRQVGLIKNPLKDSASAVDFAGDSAFTDIRGSALKKLYVNEGVVTENLGSQTTVTGTLSGARAYVDYYAVEADSDCCLDSADFYNILHVHQSQETGFVSFEKDEVVELSNGGGSVTVTGHPNQETAPAMYYADMDNFSGEVLYIDNRIQIDRDEDQTEDVKIVIDL